MRSRASLFLLLAGALASAAAVPVTMVFQQGQNYSGCTDQEIRNTLRNYGSGPKDTIAQISEFCPGCPFARAAIRFDLQSIPADAIVTGAQFELYVVGYAGGAISGTYSLFKLSQNWVEHEATWANSTKGVEWKNPGGDYVTTPVANAVCPRSAGKTWVKYNVLSSVKEFVRDQAGNFGFLLINTEGYVEVDFATCQYRIDSLAPKLTVTYEPSAGVVPAAVSRPAAGLAAAAYGRELRIAWDRGAGHDKITVSSPDGRVRAVIRADAAGSAALRGLAGGIYLVSRRSREIRSVAVVMP